MLARCAAVALDCHGGEDAEQAAERRVERRAEGAAALREVRLSGNAFRGALPASLLGGPTKEALELVDVANQGHDGEGFEGPLPDFDAPNLLTFLAGENALAGPLPASLGSGAPNLETLDLSHNAIDGCTGLLAHKPK